MPNINVANIDLIRFAEQGSTPDTPDATFSGIYMKSDGLYVIDDAGTVTGPLIDSASIDHGALSGLGDDDHTQYLLADGTRALAGAWDMGSQALTNVNIDSGVITGITDLAIADGGTGASDAATARTNLGLVAGGAGDIWVEKAGDAMTGTLSVSVATTTDDGIIVKTTDNNTTNNLVEGQNSSSALQFAFSPEGHLGVGNAPLTDRKIYGKYLDTDTSGTYYVVMGESRPNPGSSSSGTYIAIRGVAQTISGNAQNITGSIRAMSSEAQHIGSGLVSNVYGGHFNASNAGAGTITHLYGFWSNVSKSSGTVTNAYGAYINPVTAGATLNYGLYTNAGLVRFGDQLKIDGSQDIIQQILQAHSSQTANLFEAQSSSAEKGVVISPDAKEIRFYDSGASNYVGLKSPALTGNQTYIFPDADGSANQVLSTDGSGNLSWETGGTIDTSTLHGGNLIKNYPSLEGADGAQPDWWDEDGDGTLTEEGATGEGIPQIHERVLKMVASADNASSPDNIYQEFRSNELAVTTANVEPTLDDNVSKISCSCWVYTATAGTTTLELYDAGAAASIATDTTTTTSAWTYLSIENQTFQDQTQIRIRHSANSATFYVALPQLNVGTTVQSWMPRGIIRKLAESGVLLNTNPTNTFTDLDLSSACTGITVIVDVFALVVGSNDDALNLRRNGSSATGINARYLQKHTSVSAQGTSGNIVQCDAGQVIEYADGTDLDTLYITLRGFWEWE
jgi:hypothetical protein